MESNRSNKGSTGGLAGLITAKIVCCGTLVLAATGALGGVGGWLSNGGFIWLVVIAAFAITGWAFLRRRTRQSRNRGEAANSGWRQRRGSNAGP